MPRAAAAAKPPRKKSAVLSETHAAVVDGVASGLTVKEAMGAAGMTPHDGTGNELMNRADIKAALSHERRRNQYLLGMTREKVLEGIMEAVEQAKVLADPVAQIMGWKEVAKICGFYAPEVKRIELSNDAKGYLQRLEQMSDEDLLKLGSSDVVDVEFTEVKEG